MTHERRLESIPDDELLRRLARLLNGSRRCEAELVAHIGEVDRRKLYAREAVPSMFAYCTKRLYLSEHEAYVRITAARAARHHPVLLVMLRDGRLHLSGVARLASHLTEENRDSLLARAAHKSKRQIEELIAELAPRPDVRASIRKLPDREPKPEPSAPLLVSELLTKLHSPSHSPEVEPLSPARYRIQFTASAQLNEKLQRLRALMRAQVPDGDLAALIEVAVTEKLERLEARRFGVVKAPRKTVEETDTTPSTRHIPAPIRRAVYARDGNRCTFVDKWGRRCEERDGLELHHHEPYGRGGDHRVDNVSLRCRTHNLYEAERDYGKEVMDQYRRSTGIVCEPEPV